MDKATGNFARYRIASNNEAVVKSMTNAMKKSSLQLMTSRKVTPHAPADNLTPILRDARPMPYDFENGVHLTELERSIGDFAGYEIKLPQQEKAQTLASYSTITVTVNNAMGLEIRNLWIHPNHNYHYHQNGGWQLDEVRTLNTNVHHTFTGGGFTGHRIVSNPSYFNSRSTHNNVILWDVWGP